MMASLVGDMLGAESREMINRCEKIAGSAAWPIVMRIAVNDLDVAHCRAYLPMQRTERVDRAIIMDRLCVALDRIAPLLGVEG
jgi:hypothetical protein